MMADTLVVVLMLMSPAQPLQTDTVPSVTDNRFTELFRQADEDFERKYHLREKLRQASKEAAIEADRKTADERKRILDSTSFMKIVKELKDNSVYGYP